MLTLQGINQYYGDSHTLRNVDLTLAPGRIFCLLGRNGVGKTTLLNTVLGLLPARSGSANLAGRPLDGLATESRIKQGIGYVPQGRMIFPDLTVRENLLLALAGRGSPAAAKASHGVSAQAGGTATAQAARALRRDPVPPRVYEFFPVLREMAQRRGGDLSGGQQQQLAIGRALVLEPRLLLLDEPCEGIQPNIVQLIGTTLKRLRDEDGMTVLLVEQKLPFARAVGDEFGIMDRGRLVAHGAMDALTDDLVDEYLTV
jgi:urea transport system ATP-binding protein